MNCLALSLICAAALLPCLAVGQTNDPASYQAISKRNAFGLKPTTTVVQTTEPVAEPKEDLLLKGAAGFGKTRYALFTITEPGKPASHFVLHEGEENEWLEIRAINVEDGVVKGLLKKPVVRMRTVGAEVVMAFQNSDSTEKTKQQIRKGN